MVIRGVLLSVCISFRRKHEFKTFPLISTLEAKKLRKGQHIMQRSFRKWNKGVVHVYAQFCLTLWLSSGILQWVVISFSRGSSHPEDRTCASCSFCIGRQVLYHWAIWEVLFNFLEIKKKKKIHIKTTPLKLLLSIF